ncbi:transcriptional regulator [Bowmanella sp. Y26]|uniref:helix-turn-helix transcriptional regulator n=1 Tax=Bowmanella yangjiangensis TaxID=2811230 RepID=UPI001BDCE89F|nr:metalloregulator ArsR/SmtB family transcription factor [Bowmanella yangjiangensis]MBT1063827.1 transcriptional regulator [Bowmanella yangjiangensis]
MDSRADKILYLLKNQGEMTAQQLAEALQITAMGARQHLLQLADDELVSHSFQPALIGRPKQYWHLTKLAQRRFADMHSQLSVHLLESVRAEFGESGLQQVIARRETTMRQDYLAKMSGLTDLVEKLDCLCQIRNREGYMASWHEEPGVGYWFVENHCPICAAARCSDGFCQSELALFQACIGDKFKVQRQEHILDGARRCAYLITRCDKMSV